MSVPWGLFLTPRFGRSQVVRFMRTVKNAGLTERFGEEFVDVWSDATGVVHVDAADVEAFEGELKKAEHGGSISTDMAAYFGFAHCFLVEGVGADTVFDGHRVFDLERALARVVAAFDEEYDDGTDGVALDSLRRALERAVALHVAVVFEE